jgi:molecular chaperone HtpG
VLSELIKFAADEGAYNKFWFNFGAVLKEGLYEDSEYREELLKLLRVRSTEGPAVTSLEAYVSRMKEGQDAIYYICGENAEKLANNPHLEGFRAKGVEVLLLTDNVDDFWPPAVEKFGDKLFKSVTRAGQGLDKIKGGAEKPDNDNKAEAAGELDSLIALMKLTLGEEVKDVRGSDRLTESAVCLVADDGDIDIHLERFLKQHNQIAKPSKRILEINPNHPLIARMATRAKADGAVDSLKDVAFLLLDQARLMDGETLSDPVEFGRRLGGVLKQAV